MTMIRPFDSYYVETATREFMEEFVRQWEML
jgi:hypothetical protein